MQSLFFGWKTSLSKRKIPTVTLRAEILNRPVDMKPQRRRIIREELLRSIAWIGLGIVGWPLVISEVAWLDATTLTVFGLPALTWALLTTAAIGIRVATSAELQVQTPIGISMSLFFGIMLGGVGAVYLVTAGGYSALWVTSAYVAVTVVTILWYWFVRPGDIDTKMTA
ncbi:hypothetical protein PNP85_03685 [Halobacterium salinarum]|uniref:hypothetical protein n=1 Tax=Halobacterium salinarum TaxID=2242 RepID=UPI00255469CA|nr:hypothetical protein [Halobacterium salinarum]MDL0138610.1 hypothetical protein [Halobacterium salinarum]